MNPPGPKPSVPRITPPAQPGKSWDLNVEADKWCMMKGLGFTVNTQEMSSWKPIKAKLVRVEGGGLGFEIMFVAPSDDGTMSGCLDIHPVDPTWQAVQLSLETS